MLNKPLVSMTSNQKLVPPPSPLPKLMLRFRAFSAASSSPNLSSPLLYRHQISGELDRVVMLSLHTARATLIDRGSSECKAISHIKRSKSALVSIPHPATEDCTK